MAVVKLLPAVGLGSKSDGRSTAALAPPLTKGRSFSIPNDIKQPSVESCEVSRSAFSDWFSIS